MTSVFELAGKVSLFGLRAAIGAFRRPLEGEQIVKQLGEIGSRSLPLVIASGVALGAVMGLHTRSTPVTFGATSVIPAVQALAFFLEIGPLVTGLLVAGRAGDDSLESALSWCAKYLLGHFQLDSSDLGVVAMKNSPPNGIDRKTWDGICIVVLRQRSK